MLLLNLQKANNVLFDKLIHDHCVVSPLWNQTYTLVFNYFLH